jgi:hypothetical protein
VCLNALELLAERLQDDASTLGHLALDLASEPVDDFRERVEGTCGRALPGARPSRLERRPGARAQPRSLESIGCLKQSEETAGFAQGERLRAQGQCRGDLLLERKERQSVDNARAQEPLGEDVKNLRMEFFEDLVAALGPACLSAQSAGNGRGGELLLARERGEDLELLSERRSPPGIVAHEPLEPSLHPAPGLHQDPGGVAPGRKEREVALEAVDEEEAARVLQDDEGIVQVDGAGAVVSLEELKGDLPEGDFP